MKQSIIISALIISTIATAQTIEKFSIDSGGASATAGNIELLYTIGEVNVQELSAGSIQISEGFINPGIAINIKINPIVFLQGPYNATATGIMFDDLRNNNLIPLTSPYTDALVVEQSVLNTTGTTAIIDWVWVELRDKTDNANILASSSALIQANGSIVATNGVSALNFEVLPDAYYVAIAHRNHLGIITANTVALSGTVTNLDLTMNPSLINGTTNAVINLNDGFYGLPAGDFDGNGQIQNTDANAVVLLIGTSGYNEADINLNGQIQNTDVNALLLPNIGRGEQTQRNGTNNNTSTIIITAPRGN